MQAAETWWSVNNEQAMHGPSLQLEGGFARKLLGK